MRKMLALAAAVGVGACQDLDVVNQNAPDLDRALAEPADVEQVIASAFGIWFNTYPQADFTEVYPQLGDQGTSTLSQRGVLWAREPREPLDNDSQGDQVWIPRAPWDSFSSCVANTNDGLRKIEEGMVIRTLNPGEAAVSDNTGRARVFAKLMQGICLGSLALTNDQVAAATEDTIVPAGYDDQIAWERTHLKPYTQLQQMAIASLEEAIAIAATVPDFVTPATWVNQNQYTKQQLVELANTMIARFLVLTPRTPAERAAVNWPKVLTHTAAGLTYDFGPTLQSGVLTSNNWVAVMISTGTGEIRPDYKYIGQADQSGGYQEWLAKPLEQRTPFFMFTTDRRVMGTPPATCTATRPVPTTCSPTGAYFRNRNTLSNFDVARGTQYQTWYGYYKRANTAYGGFTGTTGKYDMVTADENRLLRAEAMLRTGNVQGAVDLINVSRTRGVRIGTTNIASNLPAIPATNSATTRVPTVSGACVPRKDDGTCGDIMDALIWEIKMELYLADPTRWWAYARGAGLLLPGTLLHMPIPGRYLVSLEMPIYTHGGPGGTGAAQ